TWLRSSAPTRSPARSPSSQRAPGRRRAPPLDRDRRLRSARGPTSDRVSLVNHTGHPTASVCHVLREDPELADVVAPELREQALEALTAREVRVPAGPWRDREISL